ncbi:hypothetical protein CPB83DRAFT_450625 [Crepidotus variabilis]|uniref:Nephrocystin 3-like N-terminal domain-containing protein n=1 Tax=Crepidotus variabilis TaxID=179855 RepID=A0A9P6JN37_9AGAR|nr:hypothetical protein CPB83DRAFT_450625 [Crepidotus variabilis]
MSNNQANNAQAEISTSFFSGARDVEIAGNPTFTVNNNFQPHNLAKTDPIQFLLNHTAPDALVDSGDRRDPPQCAPETRDEIHRHIKVWANSPVGKAMIFWLFGSAGAGKSAICQTIAEMFQREGLLLGNFFFSRSAASTGRSNGDRLLPTLINQLQANLPETRSYIEAAIRRDPLIFTKSFSTQMTELFVKPLNQSWWSLGGFWRYLNGNKVRLIVIDGLDECQDPDIQCNLLRVIAESTKALTIPVRFLIASRPEERIKKTIHLDPLFDGVNVKSMNLDQDENACRSVEHFLLGKFAEIREAHPYLNDSWPSNEVIQTLINKSSPQFILASTTIRYIGDPKSDDHPDKRLKDIIEYSASSDADHPFDDIDVLYHFIFSNVNRRYWEKVWCILGIIYLASRQEYSIPPPTPDFFDKLFDHKQTGTVYLMLRPLASVLSIPQLSSDPIKSLHASLFDFLLEPRRSKSLLLDLAPSHLALGRFAMADVVNQFSSPNIVKLQVKQIVVHMTSIPAVGDALRFFNDFLDLLDKHSSWRNDGTIAFFSLEDIAVVYTQLYRSSQNEPSHAELLHNRLLFCENRHLSGDLTQNISNPFTSTQSKLSHYVYINRMAELKKHSIYNPPFLPNQTQKSITQIFFNHHQANIVQLHILYATIIFNSKYCPEQLECLWRIDQQIKVIGISLPRRTDWPAGSEDLAVICRKLVLQFFHPTKTPPGVENLVFNTWSKMSVKVN